MLMAPQDRRLAQEDIDTFMKNEGIFGFSRYDLAPPEIEIHADAPLLKI